MGAHKKIIFVGGFVLLVITAFSCTSLGNLIDKIIFGCYSCGINFDFWFNFWAGLLSGLALIFLVFVIGEYVIPDHNFTGEWTLMQETIAAGKYIGFKVYYKVHLLQVGKEINGFGERVFQYNEKGELEVFDPEKRPLVRIDVSGYYHKNLLRQSKLMLCVLIHGDKRESSMLIEINCRSNRNNYWGKFAATAAKAYGHIELNRTKLYAGLKIKE